MYHPLQNLFTATKCRDLKRCRSKLHTYVNVKNTQQKNTTLWTPPQKITIQGIINDVPGWQEQLVSMPGFLGNNCYNEKKNTEGLLQVTNKERENNYTHSIIHTHLERPEDNFDLEVVELLPEETRYHGCSVSREREVIHTSALALRPLQITNTHQRAVVLCSSFIPGKMRTSRGRIDRGSCPTYSQKPSRIPYMHRTCWARRK